MYPRALAVAALTTLALAAPPVAAEGQAQRRSSTCPLNGRTLLANPTARLYTRHRTERVIGGGRLRTTFVCGRARGSRRAFFLGARRSEPTDTLATSSGIEHPTLSGRYAALAQFESDGRVGPDASFPVVVNLRDGRRRAHPQPDIDSVHTQIRRLLLLTDGSIVWSETIRDQTTNAVSHRIWTAHRQGDLRLLDTGADVDPLSVARAGRTLYWQRAGTTNTKTIP